MAKISILVAVDEEWGIGLQNQLLCHLPADLQRFKKITMGKPIIMGRKTFESIGRVLPGRENIIISRTIDSIPGAVVFDSLEKALNHYKKESEVCIIGGESIYQKVINRADIIYLTVIHHVFKADVFFPKVDDSKWDCHNREFRSKDTNNPYDMTFIEYTKINEVNL